MPEAKTREVTFRNGCKGILSVAGKETEELFLGDLLVAGKKFFCSENTRAEFQKYFNGIEEYVDVTFFYSVTIKLPETLNSRRKKKEAQPAKDKKSESTHYNCTVKIPKQDALLIFDDRAKRMQRVVEIGAQIVGEIAREEVVKSKAMVTASAIS